MARPVGHQLEPLRAPARWPGGCTPHPLAVQAGGTGQTAPHSAPVGRRRRTAPPGHSVPRSEWDRRSLHCPGKNRVGWTPPGQRPRQAEARDRRSAGRISPARPLRSRLAPGGSGGQGVQLHPGKGQALRPPGQQQKQDAAPRSQVTHPPPGPHSSELPQGKASPPSGNTPSGQERV